MCRSIATVQSETLSLATVACAAPPVTPAPASAPASAPLQYIVHCMQLARGYELARGSVLLGQTACGCWVFALDGGWLRCSCAFGTELEASAESACVVRNCAVGWRKSANGCPRVQLCTCSFSSIALHDLARVARVYARTSPAETVERVGGAIRSRVGSVVDGAETGGAATSTRCFVRRIGLQHAVRCSTTPCWVALCGLAASARCCVSPVQNSSCITETSSASRTAGSFIRSRRRRTT